MKLLIRNSNEGAIPSYYIEDSSELSDIPENAPAGTIVECNATSGFTAYMKDSNDNFNEL